MKKLTIFLAVIVYLSGVVGSTGALNAHQRGLFPRLNESRPHAQQTLSFSFGISLVPATWFLTPFMTGFYYYGWTLSREPYPCTEKSQDIWCEDNYRVEGNVHEL